MWIACEFDLFATKTLIPIHLNSFTIFMWLDSVTVSVLCVYIIYTMVRCVLVRMYVPLCIYTHSSRFYPCSNKRAPCSMWHWIIIIIGPSMLFLLLLWWTTSPSSTTVSFSTNTTTTAIVQPFGINSYNTIVYSSDFIRTHKYIHIFL